MITPGAFYIVKQQFSTGCLYHWKAPFTTGDDVLFPEGLVFQLDVTLVAAASAVYIIGLLCRNIFFMIWVILHGFRRLFPLY